MPFRNGHRQTVRSDIRAKIAPLPVLEGLRVASPLRSSGRGAPSSIEPCGRRCARGRRIDVDARARPRPRCLGASRAGAASGAPRGGASRQWAAARDARLASASAHARRGRRRGRHRGRPRGSRGRRRRRAPAARVAAVTPSLLGSVGEMSCNPRLDAPPRARWSERSTRWAGSAAADASGIQFRVLNASKVPRRPRPARADGQDDVQTKRPDDALRHPKRRGCLEPLATTIVFMSENRTADLAFLFRRSHRTRRRRH